MIFHSYDKRFKHGCCKRKLRTKAYRAWQWMRIRCNNPNNDHYQYYGARGIIVCERWNDFRNFLKDMGEKPEGLTLERIDNDKGYFPENCKWATVTEQSRNNRHTKLNPLKVQVIKKLLKESCLNQREIAEIFNVCSATINHININRIWTDIIYIPPI